VQAGGTARVEIVYWVPAFAGMTAGVNQADALASLVFAHRLTRKPHTLFGPMRSFAEL
jgi:hypothetical protein